MSGTHVRPKHPTPPPPPSPPVVPPPPPTPVSPPPPTPSAAVSANSPYRELGNTTRDAFKQAMSRTVAGPVPFAAELDAMYDALAAKGVTRLAVPMSWMECKNSTYPTCGVPQHSRNPWSVTGSGDAGSSGRWAAYSSYAKAAQAWASHVTAGSPYQGATSIADFIHIYAPASDNNDEARYVQVIVDGVNALPVIGTTPAPPSPPPPNGALTFGRVPTPPGLKNRIIPDAQNHAWDNLGQRVLRGIVYHRMLGTLWGTDSYFRNGAQGLTDWGVDHNTGEILFWNDYKGRGNVGVSPNRAPWASGPWQNPPGDGRAFVARFGVNGINRDLSAIEISGDYDTPLSEAGIQAIVALSAYLADVAKVPHDTYPIDPATGLVFTYWHRDFTNEKPCPGAVVVNATSDIIERTATLLKRYQTGG